MKTSTKIPSLKEFLTVTAGSKEMGLIIAKDSDELARFIKSLDKKGLKRSEKVYDLSKLQKSYFVIDEVATKDAYDFAVQYPTRSVKLFNKDTMRIETFFPDYSTLNLVLLIVKDDLNKIQTKNFDLLSAVGPVYKA